MEDRVEDTSTPEPKKDIPPLVGIDARTFYDGIRLNHRRPNIREVISNHPRAHSCLHRKAEAMEFDPGKIYCALERVQENYDAFEAAERRPIVNHGDNFVAVGLNGADWHALIDFIRQETDDEMREYIVHVVIKVMSEITDESWHSQNSLPLVLAEHEVRDVLAYHKEAYEGPGPEAGTE